MSVSLLFLKNMLATSKALRNRVDYGANDSRWGGSDETIWIFKKDVVFSPAICRPKFRAILRKLPGIPGSANPLK